MSLKECPFCGEKESIAIKYNIVKGFNKTLNGLTYIFIECLCCGARTDSCFESDAHILKFKSAKHEAISRWNRRPNEELY